MDPRNPQREWIDACRAGHHDWQLPELQALAAALETDARLREEFVRSEQNDRVIREALFDAPPPAGLCDRLLASLDSAQPATCELAAPAMAGGKQARGSRRWWLMAVATAAVVLLAVGIAVWRPTAPREISKEQLAASVDAWLQQVSPSAQWKRTSPPSKYPLDPLVLGQPTAWRSMPGEMAGAVYDLTRPGKQRALLFVVRTPNLYRVGNSANAYTRLTASRGNTVAAWQRGDLLYVLAVVEDGQRLDHFIRRQRLT